MEKFGIFELLDTLSALILPEGQPSAAPDKTPNAEDRAFSPPSYGERQAPSVAPTASALSAFLDRHDRAVKQIGGSADAKPPKP